MTERNTYMRPTRRRGLTIGLALALGAIFSLEAGEIAHYDFASDTLDSSGNGLHASGFGVSFTADRFGTPGEAVELDGIDDYISIPNYDWEEISYEFWLNAGNNLATILLEKAIDDRGVGGEVEVTAAIGSNGFPGAIDARTGYPFNSYNRIYVTDEVIQENTYHHVVFAISRTGTMGFYVDGALVGSEVPVAATNRFNAETLIGSLIIPNAPFLQAMIDEFVIHDVKLSPEEILTRFLVGSVPPDSDGDGVRDDEDVCPDSDTSRTVVIDGCDSGVPNLLNVDDQGCSISDLLANCADARNHGQYVRCVAGVLRELVNEGLICSSQRRLIQRCAARADLP